MVAENGKDGAKDNDDHRRAIPGENGPRTDRGHAAAGGDKIKTRDSGRDNNNNGPE